MLYLNIRDQYPTQALNNTRVLALSGMTDAAAKLLSESLSRQVPSLYPIDCYFYSDYLTNHILDVFTSLPLISLTQYTYPSRIVFADGNFKREGFDLILQWMVDNREMGYFRNLQYFQLTGHNIASFEESTNCTDLQANIEKNLKIICNDKDYFPLLNTMNFNDNGFSKVNDGFNSTLMNACSFDETGVIIQAEDTPVTIPQLCNPDDTSSYLYYYDLNDPVELDQCRYTWNWEYKTTPKYTTTGPYPNENTVDWTNE